MTQTPQPAPHHLCFRLVDQQSTPIRDARRYTLTWTDQGATTATTREGTTNDQGRTEQIQTRGPVLVTLAIAPPAGGECRPVNQAVSSKPEGRYPVVTVRLAFNATTATMPQSQDHCETLTLRAGQQRVKYVIDNVDTIRNNGRDYATYLTNFPYLIVDAVTLEVLHAGTTRTEPARFTGNRSQVQTAEVAVDGVARVGIVLGAAANGEQQRWRDDAATLVMYRVVPAAQGLTTVTITEQAVVGDPPNAGQALTPLIARSPSIHDGILNGRVWRTFTRSYDIADIRRWITGRLTLDVHGGITTWYEIAHPSERQIVWAEQHGQISPEQAAQYRNAPPQPRNPGHDQGAPALPALRMQLEWADLLDPIYSGRIENIPPSDRERSHGGDIIIAPLDLTIRLAPGFSDNAEEVTRLNQAQVLTHNHPFVYMMLLSACAQAGVTHVKIVGSWRPMLGSILHKLGDALDITEVDSRPDRLPVFTFNGSHVRNNALANRFGSLLHDHRYARPDQHIYVGDDYPHTSDASHNNHLHITCNSRVALQPRDLAGYRGAADPPAQPGRPLPAVPEELQRRNQVR